jgi:hypothetical protein
LAVFGQLSILSVESVNLKLALLDLQVSLLDVTLFIAHLLFFFLKLNNQLLKLLLKVTVLVVGVQVINFDSANFVGDVFNLNLLFADVLVGSLCLLKKVSTRFLDGLLLRGMVNDLITDILSLRVKLHDGLLKDGLFILNVGLFLVHASRLTLGLVKRCL